MKKFAAMALAATVVKAEMEEYDSLFRYFGSCQGDDFGSTDTCQDIGRENAQCCDFVVVEDTNIDGQFCVSDK